MVDDILLNKAAIIERCLQRIRDEYAGNARHLIDNITRQDAIILNLQRACQASIDLAMHLVRQHQLGPPQDSRDAFTLLIDADLLDATLGDRLKRMVGFRNIAIHDYRQLNLEVVQAIIEQHLDDFTTFTEIVLRTRGFQNR
ncbi:MAG TPA: DUF86 domain-containing protein [Rhodothermales bacterium]|nr:DUF86 domain-containing protein [Rhodothermales bacterium]